MNFEGKIIKIKQINRILSAVIGGINISSALTVMGVVYLLMNAHAAPTETTITPSAINLVIYLGMLISAGYVLLNFKIESITKKITLQSGLLIGTDIFMLSFFVAFEIITKIEGSLKLLGLLPLLIIIKIIIQVVRLITKNKIT